MKNKKFYFLLLALVLLYVVYYYMDQRTSTNITSTIQSVDLSTCSLVSLENDRVALTIPSDYVYGATQKDLTAVANSNGYESITLNEDGSATYIMTTKQHAQMLSDLATGIRAKLDAIPGSKNYKHVTKVLSNDDFTEFKLYTDSSSVDFDESMTTMTFTMYGTMYNAFAGITDESFHIEFYNAEDNSLLASFDSKAGGN